jgi:polyphosphate glucokinase
VTKPEPAVGTGPAGPLEVQIGAAAASSRDPAAGASLAHRRAVGIDVGGTGVKAAVVDLVTGQLVSPRMRERTPQPSVPEAVLEVAGQIVDRLAADGHADASLPAGIGLPGVVKGGLLRTAANIDAAWVGFPIRETLEARLGRSVRLINDADAAGLAELAFGAARGVPGTVLLLTIGTGIGSALLADGRLVDSTEFGHITFRGKDGEALVSGTARERRRIGWRRWAREFSEYLALLEKWLWPDLIILGGGVSKEYARYGKWLTSRAPIVTARFLNTAGIIGAALAAGGHDDAPDD